MKEFIRNARNNIVPSLILVISAGMLAGCMTYYGAANIESDPPGAQVFDMEDGFYIGVTPLTHVWKSSDAPRKFMNIRLHKEGYSDELSTFWLNLDYSSRDRAWNSPQSLDIKLKSAP